MRLNLLSEADFRMLMEDSTFGRFDTNAIR